MTSFKLLLSYANARARSCRDYVETYDICYVLKHKDFQAFRVGLVKRLTSAEFSFLFMVSNSCTIDSYSDNFES